MAFEKSPAFQMYPKDFLADSRVIGMTLQELGAYIKLLLLCWVDGSLPTDERELARLCGVNVSTFQRLWPAICLCFCGDAVDGHRLIHPRLEAERVKQASYRQTQAQKGKAGAAARWPVPLNRHGTRIAGGIPTHSSPSPSPSSDLKKVHTSADADYEAFRQAYPTNRRVGGAPGRSAFQRSGIGKHGDSLATVLLALEQQKRSEQWRTPKLIPSMTTWLNQERWLQTLPEHDVTGNGGPRTSEVKTYAEMENERYRVHVLGEKL